MGPELEECSDCRLFFFKWYHNIIVLILKMQVKVLIWNGTASSRNDCATSGKIVACGYV